MKKSAIYFTNVASYLVGNFALFTGHMFDQGTEPTFTRFAYASDGNKWGLIGDLRNDLIYALISVPSAGIPLKTDFYALGCKGTLRLMLAEQSDQDLQIERKDTTGKLEGLCVTSEGMVVVCGSQKEVLGLLNGQWRSLDQGLFEKFNGLNDSTLNAITELVPGVLLAVGSHGQVIRRNNQGWQTLNAPTNRDLYALLTTRDGNIWIAGDGGTLLWLSEDGQTFYDHSNANVSTDPFNCLALHHGKLYIAATRKLLELLPGDNILQEVAGPFKAGCEFHSLSANGDYLWATGDENVYRLGPMGWEYFLCPDNS